MRAGNAKKIIHFFDPSCCTTYSYSISRCNGFFYIDLLRDAIHTHFVTLVGKWTIVGGWVKHGDDKSGKVGKMKS